MANSKKAVVIGGRGVMGRLCCDLLSGAGHVVEATGSRDWELAKELLPGCDLCILSVPMAKLGEIARKAAPFLKPGCLLADVGSVKEEPLKAMLEAHSGPVLGLHPMFGEGSRGFHNQTVIMCKGRDEAGCAWLVECLRSAGARLVEMEARAHDDVMIYAQVMRHFVTYAFGEFLKQEGADLARVTELSPAINRMNLYMLGRFFSKEGPLYAELMTFDERRRAAVLRLGESFMRSAKLVGAGDIPAICGELESTRQWMGDFCGKSSHETDFLIQALLDREADKK